MPPLVTSFAFLHSVLFFGAWESAPLLHRPAPNTRRVTVADGFPHVVIIRFLLFLGLVTSLLPIPICLTLFACNPIRSRSLTTPTILGTLHFHRWSFSTQLT